MARRYRTRGEYLAAEAREFLSALLGMIAFFGGLWLAGAVLAHFNL